VPPAAASGAAAADGRVEIDRRPAEAGEAPRTLPPTPRDERPAEPEARLAGPAAQDRRVRSEAAADGHPQAAPREHAAATPDAPTVDARSRPAVRRLDPAEVAAQLSSIVGPVQVDEDRVSAVTLITVAGPGLDLDAVSATAVRVLPFLVDPRLPHAMSQATVRASLASLVVTPQAACERGSAILAAGVAHGAPLAMVERASLRAVGTEEQGEDPGPPPRTPARLADDELRTAAVPANVRAVAGSLRAFGPVTPAVLRDPAGTLLMYLFLPSHVDPRPMAGFARELRRQCAGASLGAVSSVIARVGHQRLVVWELEATRGSGSVLVALGAVDRPGLARIELERAALRLAAL
jgi:hypothetical protein